MSDEDLRRIAIRHSANINKHGGAYINGHSHSFLKKLEVGAKYNNALRNGNGIRPNISELARECRVSRGFVKKVEEELLREGRILTPSEIQQNKAGLVGPGSRSFDEIDSAILLFLYLEEPSRSLRSYVDWLEIFTGTTTSRNTVSRFFLRTFPNRGGFCRPNLVPFDKFHPKNIERAFEFLDIISKIDPARIKFGDEKHLKGDAIFNRKVRRNPITGEVPEMIVTSDFRNRYNLTGFCSINPMTTKYAVWCSLHECINDADQFHLELEYAIHSGFFRGGDVLVLDNAAVHTGKENSVLQDYLWEKYAIFLLFLPARAPEWNPMEQVWTSLVQRLRELPVNKCREVAKETGPHLSAYAAIEIISGITYEEVKQFYRGSGLVPQD